VGGAVLEVTVPEPVRARTLQALRGVGGQAPTDDQDHGRIVLPAPDGARTLTEALRQLDTAGVAPEDVTLRKPTLDEVFLALTGHRATTPTGNGHDPVDAADRRGQQQLEGAAR
jgi:ABC-2 type transport system ATP-binding protein